MPGFQYGLKRAGGATMAGLGNAGVDVKQGAYAPTRLGTLLNKAFYKPISWGARGISRVFTGNPNNGVSNYIEGHLRGLSARDAAFDKSIAEERKNINDYWVPYDPNTTMNINEDLKATHATARTTGHVFVAAAGAGAAGKPVQTAVNGVNRARQSGATKVPNAAGATNIPSSMSSMSERLAGQQNMLGDRATLADNARRAVEGFNRARANSASNARSGVAAKGKKLLSRAAGVTPIGLMMQGGKAAVKAVGSGLDKSLSNGVTRLGKAYRTATGPGDWLDRAGNAVGEALPFTRNLLPQTQDALAKQWAK